MKSLKKIVASILAVSAVAAQMTSFASNFEDVTGTRYEEPIQILSALEIMIGDESGKFRPDDTIIRSEVAKMAVHALGLEDAAQSATGTVKFPDVPADHWANGYINVAASQGLVIGDESGNFHPNNTITYAEAMTIFVRALGYEPAAEAKGGYPSGYIVVGSDNGLAKNVQGSTNEAITRGNVAFVASNALTVNLMEQTGFGPNASHEVTDKTLLENKLNVTKADGQITANQYTTLEGDSTLSDGQVRIGDDVFDTISDINHLLGYNVTYYYRENENTGADEIILVTIPSEKNQSLTIKADLFEAIGEKNGNKTIEYYKNDKDSRTSTATLATDAKMIYNGKAAEMSDDLLNIKDKSGNVVLLDTTRDGKYNLVFVTSYSNMVVEEITSSGKIVDKYGQPSLKLDEEEVDFVIRKDGAHIDINDLKEYDVLSIAASMDKKLYDITVSNKTVTGKVTQMDDEGVYIDGELYKIAANYTDDISLTTEGTFYLDVEDKIAAADTTTTISSNYAYLLRAYAAVDADERVTFKVFTKEGEEKTYEAAEKVRFNGKGGQYAKDVVAQINNKDDNSTPKQLITFETNSEGKIVKINTAQDNTSTGAADEHNFTKNYVLTGAEFNGTLNKIGNVKLDENTVIFDINDEDSEYAIASLSMFEDGAKYNVVIFDRTEDFMAKAVIVTDASFQTNAEASLAIVDKIVTAVNDNDEQGQRITLIQDGEEVSFFAEDEDVLKKESGKQLANGDLIQYKTNSKNEITAVRVLLDTEKKETEFTSNPAENLELVYGKVTKKFTSSVNVTVDGGDVLNFQIPKEAAIYSVDTTATRNNIEVASFGDIQAFDEDEGNRIFIKIYKDVVQEVVIVK
jgi:5-hydroxyisourate hydrolase-like protein (transthyretin family)